MIDNSIQRIAGRPKTCTFVQADNGVTYIEFAPLKEIDFITHGFSTRLGGVSSGIYKSMNLTFGLSDNPQHVKKNFELMGEALKIEPEHMVYSKQTHTTNVIKVDKHHFGMGITRERTFDNIDGLVTDVPGLCLVTSFADCIPIVIVDKKKRCIASVHSGWKGTVGNISQNAVLLMKQEFNSDVKDMVALIGPGICPSCYEVGSDVAEQFINRYAPEEQQQIVLKGLFPDKYQLDLTSANRYNLIHAGIDSANIFVSDICTCCNSDVLFSHRATQGKRGILCMFVCIRYDYTFNNDNRSGS